jgi:hypothetical protein
MINNLFVETHQVCLANIPVAMNTAGLAGDYLSFKNYGRIAIVFIKAVGTNGDDPTITVLQAKTVAGGSSKALNITRVDKKQAAPNLLAVGQYTTSTSASPASHDTFSTNTWTNSDLAEQAAVVVIEYKAEDLDIDNGFCCITATVADVGTNAQLGAMLMIGLDPKFGVDPLPSAIVD